MKHFDLSHNVQTACYDAPILIQNPLTESSILELQDTFLTNGFHHIKVKDIESGRSLISTFLDSLGLYHDVACLTAAGHEFLDPLVTHLHFGSKNIDEADKELEYFFIEHFYYDFLWIETSQELDVQPWYPLFKTKLNEFNVNHGAPIIFMSYSE